jgi:hypothetical protein
MLTATAVCRRATSIKVRISINNSAILGLSDPDLVAASFPRLLCSPVLVLK